MKLSKRAQGLKPSPTLALAAKAKELASQGKDIISLSVGEPDWPTFPAAVTAGVEAIKSGQTKYGPSAGIPELRKAIVEKTKEDLGVDYKVNEVTVSAGGKFVIFSALQSLIEEGYEVLIPAPYWVSYPTMVELAGGSPVIVPSNAAANFRVTAKDIESKITNRTKLLILNSPSNPTGEVFNKSEVQDIAAVLKRHPHVLVMSDDIYNRLFFDGRVAPHLLHVAPELKDRVVIINGVSKTYSMTGWRVGWAMGPAHLIQAMTDYQSQSVSCTPTFCQLAALKAMKECESDLQTSLVKLKERRDYAFEQLKSIPGLELSLPGGAFYLWPSIQRFIGKSYQGKKITDSGVFCELFLDSFGVAVVPGKEFGIEGYLRMSYVLEKPRMSQAFDRLREFVSAIK